MVLNNPTTGNITYIQAIPPNKTRFHLFYNIQKSAQNLFFAIAKPWVHFYKGTFKNARIILNILNKNCIFLQKKNNKLEKYILLCRIYYNIYFVQ